MNIKFVYFRMNNEFINFYFRMNNETFNYIMYFRNFSLKEKLINYIV